MCSRTYLACLLAVVATVVLAVACQARNPAAGHACTVIYPNGAAYSCAAPTEGR